MHWLALYLMIGMVLWIIYIDVDELREQCAREGHGTFAVLFGTALFIAAWPIPFFRRRT